MSEDELIEGYIQGRISRRVFVRRLVAGGLSMAAAVAYGNVLGPAAAAAAAPAHRIHPPHHKHHPDHDNDD